MISITYGSEVEIQLVIKGSTMTSWHPNGEKAIKGLTVRQ